MYLPRFPLLLYRSRGMSSEASHEPKRFFHQLVTTAPPHRAIANVHRHGDFLGAKTETAYRTAHCPSVHSRRGRGHPICGTRQQVRCFGHPSKKEATRRGYRLYTLFSKTGSLGVVSAWRRGLTKPAAAARAKGIRDEKEASLRVYWRHFDPASVLKNTRACVKGGRRLFLEGPTFPRRKRP